MTRILTRGDVAALLTLEDCIVAVEEAFRAHAEGRTIPPAVLGAHVDGGGFHLKTAGIAGEHFAAKLNGNFYDNAKRFGLPRIQGVVVLCDARNGLPLAVMDSMELTAVRTAAATAVAAKHLARADAAVATVVGCGLQGRIQLAALRCVRTIEKVYLVDAERAAAERLATDLGADPGAGIAAEVLPAHRLGEATRASDICVTCTPSRTPFLDIDDVVPGVFVAAVGADSEEKNEIRAELLRAAKIVVDHLDQCATIGDLHHAIERGVLTRSDVHGELADIVAGRKPGRTADDDIFIFDSTGVALQDVAAAALVYQRAQDADVGLVVELSGTRPAALEPLDEG